MGPPYGNANGRFLGNRKSEIATGECVNLVGDFEQRRSGCRPMDKTTSCFERGNTDRFASGCSICLAQERKWAKKQNGFRRRNSGRKARMAK